jgi:hypothetical protein
MKRFGLGFLALILLVSSSGCANQQVTVMVTTTVTPIATPVAIESGSSSATFYFLESPQDYEKADVVQLSRQAENSNLSSQGVDWAQGNEQAFIDGALNQAVSANLDSTNLNAVLNSLMLNFNPASFEGKSEVAPGESILFRLSQKTIQLPYMIEKAKFEGQDAWVIVLNWEMGYAASSSLMHIAAVVYRYGTTEVLFAMSCA